MEESLDDLLLQLEKSSSDLKKQSPSTAGNNTTQTKTTSSKKSYRDADNQPVEVSSTRYTTTTTTHQQQNGGDRNLKPLRAANDSRASASPAHYTADVVDQARRLPQNGYSSVNKTYAAKNRSVDDVAERDPIIYPHNPVVPVIASYREQHRNSPSGYASSAEREFSPSSYRSSNGRAEERGGDTGRYADVRQRDSRNDVPAAARSARNQSDSGNSSRATTTVPSNATRALDELMQSFGTLHTASSPATRERHRSSSVEGPRAVPRPYNELNETKIEHAESEAELSDMRGKSPTPPRERPRMSPVRSTQRSSSQRNESGPDFEHTGRIQYNYQPIEYSAKGTSVSYNDPRYQSLPAARAASRDRTIDNTSGSAVEYAPVRLNSSSSSRLSRPRPSDDDLLSSPTHPRVASYERLAMTTTRTTTPDDDDEAARRTTTKPSGGVRVLPSQQQPTSILKRSPTPTRETVNRRIAGVNTENTTAFGDVGRPRSVTLSDNEGDYESVREYKYERRETTTTSETQQDQIDASNQQQHRRELNEKPTPRARTNRPSQAEVMRSTTTRTVTTANRDEHDDSITPSPSMLQPASILRNSNLITSGNTSGNKTCSECGKSAAMNYDGVTPDPDNPFVTALGRLWHMQCFACNKCGTVLNNVPFFERQQQLWCERDYLHHFSPKCAQCAEPIIGQCVTALGSQQFHPNCFVCNDCKKPLLGTGGGGGGGVSGYVEDQGTAMCNLCYDERYGKKCRGCGSTIRGGTSYVESLGAAWHDECFRCHMCNDPINRGAGGAAALHELDGKPVCERDYYGRFGATCAACGQAILGRCITAMGKKFHPDHFCCSYCKRELNRGLFKELEGVPWCHTCWAKVFINEEQVVIDQRATHVMPLAPLAALNRNSPARV